MTYGKFNSSNNQGGGFRQDGGYKNYGNNHNGGNPGGGFKPNYQKGNYQKGNYNKEDRREEENKPLPEPYYYRAYAMTCSGEIPLEINARFRRVLKMLENEGLTVRYSSGEKADDLVEEAVTTNKELHLPWKKFAEKEGGVTFNSPEVLSIAKDNHGAWNSLSETVHKFLGRTVRLLMGEKAKSPALFLLTYTEDGCENIREKTPKTGYMTFPIQVASKANIPVFNLQREDVEERLRVYLGMGSKEELGSSNEDFDMDDM